MLKLRRQIVIVLAAACVLSALVTGALAAETPKRGGILTFVVGANGPPSFDGHREARQMSKHLPNPPLVFHKGALYSLSTVVRLRAK